MGGNNLALSGALAISPGTSNTGFLTFQGTGTSTAGQNVATVPGGVSIGSSATNAPALTVNSAAINGNVANYGNLTFLNSGTLTATNNATVTGTLTNDGFMATGSSNASGPSVIGGNVVAVQGNYVQTSAGLLQTEISGSSSVSSDQIDVSGTDTLAGNLAIIQNSSFAPTPGVPIPLLRYSSYTGSFNTSIQSGVTSNSSYLGLSYKPQELDLEATPPLATLANLSANIYSGVSGFANFIPLTTNSLLIPSQAAYTGFDAVAYDTTDLSNSQIIIAFRGTDVSNGVTAMKNAAADVSFTGGDQPTPDLETSTSYAAAFVKQIEADYPNAFITLTGHSLGGAIAQLVGKASGLSTVAFNAPGAEQLYSALSTNLQVGTWSPSAGVNVNYRIYGDQVSLVGMPVGSVVTLPQPVGTTFISNSDPAKEVVSNLLTFLQLHDRNTVVAQIGMQPVSETGELNDANAFQAAAVAGAGMTKGQELIQITLNVIAGAGTLIDPSGGTAFTLAEQTGSPAITSVDFPALTGVTSYDLRQEVNEVWSTYQIIPAGSSYTLPSGTTAIDFTPLNSSDSPVILTDAFLFDANFAATGTFTGTIASNFSVWTGQADGTSWSNPGNWSGDMVPTEGDDAYIGSGFGTVMIPAGTFAVNALTAASPVEVASGGILALYGSSAINGSGASLTIDSGGTVQIDTTGSSSNPGPLIVSNLSIAGTLDLGSSALDVQGGSLSTITREIASGYNGGKWTGTGITSSSAATNSQHLNALGVIQNNQSGLALFTSVNLFDGIVPGASDVLVKYTDYGDALLNGNVTAADYLQIDNADSYNQAHSSTPLTGWYNGDFNYDGVINGDDYTMIDNAYNSQGSVGFAASPASQIAANKAQMAETADATGSSKGHATPGGSPAVAPAAQGVTAAIGDAAELRKKHSNLWATLEEDNS
jgi:hypothetical protein